MSWFGSERAKMEFFTWRKRFMAYSILGLIFGLGTAALMTYCQTNKDQWRYLGAYFKATIISEFTDQSSSPYEEWVVKDGIEKIKVVEVNDKKACAIFKEKIYNNHTLSAFLEIPFYGGVLVFVVLTAWINNVDYKHKKASLKGHRLRGPYFINPGQFSMWWPYKDQNLINKLLLFLGLKEKPLAGLRYTVLNDRNSLTPLVLPAELEQYHIAVMGATGSGKSTFLIQTLQEIEERGEQVIIYDPVGEMAELFFNSKRGDWILNPFDQRCPFIDLSGEIVGESEVHRLAERMDIAKAVFPDSFGTGSNGAFFLTATRKVFSFLLKHKLTNQELIRLMGNPGAIIKLAAKDPDAKEVLSLLDEKSVGQFSGILGTLALAADSLRLLPTAGERTFKFSDWTKARGPGWIFITGTHDTRVALKHLHSIIFDLLVKRSLKDLNVANAVPVWFILDELQTLERLPSLEIGLTESRKFKCRWVIGCQDKNQLDERYGEKISNTILSQPRTKLFLMVHEANTAKWVSTTIGDVEIERIVPSNTATTGNKGDSISYSSQKTIQPLMLPSEITSLEPLESLLKFQECIIRFRFRREELPKRAISFIPRRDEIKAASGVEPGIKTKVEVPNASSQPLSNKAIAAPITTDKLDNNKRPNSTIKGQQNSPKSQTTISKPVQEAAPEKLPLEKQVETNSTIPKDSRANENSKTAHNKPASQDDIELLF